MKVVVAASALRHGHGSADIEHAYRNAIKAFAIDEEGLVMVIGGDPSGNLLEIGYVLSSEKTVVIVHAMRARAKLLRGDGLA